MSKSDKDQHSSMEPQRLQWQNHQVQERVHSFPIWMQNGPQIVVKSLRRVSMLLRYAAAIPRGASTSLYPITVMRCCDRRTSIT
mmetsp:Transcript_11303/g.33526  ORF Transcript_11303/g.33526 Transcript_11303/m.33526 type:complete len:84 (+) Transcript_11303:616-867(+)